MSDAMRKPNRGWFKKGQSGNPAGRPKGRRDERTLLASSLLADEADAILKICIQRAKDGDPVALRLCMERIVPPARGRAIRLDVPSATAPVADDAGMEDDILGAPEKDIPAKAAPTESAVSVPDTKAAADEASLPAAAQPASTKAAEIDAALAAVVRAMAEGAITPEEAYAAGQVIDLRRRSLEAVELERRLARLEEVDLIIAGAPPMPIPPQARPTFAIGAPAAGWNP
jgi:hypothetical protein